MTYCIADIHGEYELLCEMLEKIKYNSEDTLYVLGDMIDKGKRSVDVLKLLMKLPGVYALIGNHEQMFLDYYNSLMRSSEDYELVLEKLNKYLGGDGLEFEAVDMLEMLPYYYECKDFICVHAGVELDKNSHLIPIENNSCNELIYSRKTKDPQTVIRDGKCVIFGHTPTSFISGTPEILMYRRDGIKSDKPAAIGDYYKIHIDTGAFLTGVLGCFCVDDCVCHYVRKG